MALPLVSMVIPHLPGTRVEYLKKALEGIEYQDYPNIEVVLVSEKASEIDNILTGIERSKGEIIHIHHDDDWLTYGAVRMAVEYMKDYDMIHGCAHEVGGRDYIPRIQIPTLEQLAKKNLVHNATLFYRRDVFDKVKYEQDWLFLLRCIEKDLKIGFCPCFVKNYRLHPGSLTNSKKWQKVIRPSLNIEVYERYPQFFKKGN